MLFHLNNAIHQDLMWDNKKKFRFLILQSHII